jgi:alpha-beta hydrolase superfamily lysophospholipase
MRALGAGRVVVAVPVGPPHTFERLRGEADEVVALREEEGFSAIGQFYRSFEQVPDEQVKRLLDTFAADSATQDSAWIERDGVRLAAKRHLPRPGAPVVVFVHGLGSSKDSPRNVVVAERLFDEGIGSILFDLSGHGESSTDAPEGIDTYVDDLVAVAGWAARQSGIDPQKLALAGSSLGAVVALRAVTRGAIHPLALVLRAPPIEVEDVRGLETPTLLLIGSRDPLLTNALRAASASPSIDVRVVERANHLFQEPGTLDTAVELTAEWLASRFAAATVPLR